MLLRPRALAPVAVLAAILATVHLMGALGENATGHHAHLGVVEGPHHGAAAAAPAPDAHAPDHDAHHGEDGAPQGDDTESAPGADSEDHGDRHAPEDSDGSCGYSAATGTASSAVDTGGAGDPSTLILEHVRRGCLEQPGRPAPVRTPHLVKDLQVIRV